VLHQLCGEPLRSPAPDRRWLTSMVLSIAKGMHESGDLSAMPVLADALEEAGCDDAAVLGHCRSAGPHVPGCWVLDLLQAKR
jgi:hypothetical protein